MLIHESHMQLKEMGMQWLSGSDVIVRVCGARFKPFHFKAFLVQVQ